MKCCLPCNKDLTFIYHLMCFTSNNIFFPCGFDYDFTCAQQSLDALSCLELLLHRSISKHHFVLVNLWSYCFMVLFPMWRNLRSILHFMYLLLRNTNYITNECIHTKRSHPWMDPLLTSLQLLSYNAFEWSQVSWNLNVSIQNPVDGVMDAFRILSTQALNKISSLTLATFVQSLININQNNNTPNISRNYIVSY